MSIPDRCDVFVAGGGPAGIGAAIGAARNGASVLLIEKTNCFGGMLTNGLVHMMRTAGDGGGVIREFWNRLVAEGSAELTDNIVRCDPFQARIVLLNMLQEAGVLFLLHTHLAEAVMDDQTVVGVRVASKDGISEIACEMAVDATGDADLAASAGAPFDKGREPDGFLQAVSLNFILAGIKEDLLPPWEEFKARCKEGFQNGELKLAPPAGTLGKGQSRFRYPSGVRHFQYDVANGIDASDTESLTAGEVICHQRIDRIYRFLRDNFEAYRDCVVIDVASHLGVRESRRIRGLATLTEDMVLGGVKHADGISRCSWYMDLHDGQNKFPLEEYRAARRPPDGDYYEIPYGCIVPQEILGLLVAGRCISSTRPANGSLRLQPTCMNLGQAAGTAAAVAIETKVQPADIDAVELRALLQKQGMEI